MSRGSRLTGWEVERAEQLHRMGLSWREVGSIIRRDWSGLSRRVANKRTMSEALSLRWRFYPKTLKAKESARRCARYTQHSQFQARG